MIQQKAQTLFQSAAIAAATTTYSGDVIGDYLVGYIVVDVTAYAGSQDLDIIVEMHDDASDAYYELDSIATHITGTGSYIYLVGRGSAFSGTGVTEVLSVTLPRRWRIAMVTTTADSITFSVGFVPSGR